MTYDSNLDNVFTHVSLRKHVVFNTEFTILYKKLVLPTDKDGVALISDGNKLMTLDKWMSKMGKNACYCDNLFLQLACEMLNRKFILVPVFNDSTNNGSGIIEIIPYETVGNPMYFLYYKGVLISESFSFSQEKVQSTILNIDLKSHSAHFLLSKHHMNALIHISPFLNSQ